MKLQISHVAPRSHEQHLSFVNGPWFDLSLMFSVSCQELWPPYRFKWNLALELATDYLQPEMKGIHPEKVVNLLCCLFACCHVKLLKWTISPLHLSKTLDRSVEKVNGRRCGGHSGNLKAFFLFSFFFVFQADKDLTSITAPSLVPLASHPQRTADMR
jgi:hypothetical protein